ncbi:hypothetical protein PAPHI01_1367 [Pancytospora philotis]|nr:hypothetical protein PAPHI01_1367 [Pancytospora philotis]
MRGPDEEHCAEMEDLRRENARLRARITKLEAECESNSVIIEALVCQARVLKQETKRPAPEPAYEAPAVKKQRVEPAAAEERSDANADAGVWSVDPEVLFAVSAAPEPAPESEKEIASPAPAAKTDRQALVAEIKTIFAPKAKEIDFKMNYGFKRFVEYAESSYEFSLMNKKVYRPKNPLKLYIANNLDKILKYIIENLSVLNLNQVCSTLFLLNADIEYRQKLVIAHDVLLEVDDCSKLPYICSALFNNLALQSDAFSAVLGKILYHQCCVDADRLNDSTVGEYLEVVKANLGLCRPEVSLWASPATFISNEPAFLSHRGAVRMASECIEKCFMLQMLCHYLDWDYTYNKFIVQLLFPALAAGRSPVLGYYCGALALNAHRLFGRVESVSRVFQELLLLLRDDGDTSVVCYLVLKQLYPHECAKWLENNQDALVRRGFSMDYLETFLLL